MDIDHLGDLVSKATTRLGGLDLLVNNAGGSFPKPLLHTSVTSFERAFRFNVTTALEQAVPAMLARGGGAVVNISSAAGRMPDRGFAAYGTAKGALSHLTRLMAADLAPHVRVNGIAVGSIATSALDTVLTDDGAPTPVAWTKVRPPQSQIGAVDPAEVKTMAEASDLWSTYATEVDRQSAREILAGKMGVQAPSPGDLVRDSGIDDDFDIKVPGEPKPKSGPKAKASPKKNDDGNVVTDFLKSREGRATINNVVRGVFGMMKKK